MPSSPSAEFQTSAGGVMLRVPAGSFLMGSPESEDGHQVWEPQREVRFETDVFLGQTPVTQSQYEAVAGENPTDHEKIADAPVDSVRWDRASAYCQTLTQIDRAAGVLPDGWEYRLPTEAEWEYACRAGTSGATYGPLDSIAWHFANADQRPHPVRGKAPNPWGFHDMLGNVWEMCQDWYSAKGQLRAGRGGSYFNSPKSCRAAARSYAWGARYCGFRLLAARSDAGPFDLTPPIEDFPPPARPPSIFDAIEANDFDLALRLVTADPAAVESVDGIPPPLHDCIYSDRPEWLEWLLDHGADIERREQDHGSTPLITAVVHRNQPIIRTLIQRGADASRAMDVAQRGLTGAFEDDPRLDREGYRDIIKLLRELGLGSSPT